MILQYFMNLLGLGQAVLLVYILKTSEDGMRFWSNQYGELWMEMTFMGILMIIYIMLTTETFNQTIDELRGDRHA